MHFPKQLLHRAAFSVFAMICAANDGIWSDETPTLGQILTIFSFRRHTETDKEKGKPEDRNTQNCSPTEHLSL